MIRTKFLRYFALAASWGAAVAGGRADAQSVSTTISGPSGPTPVYEGETRTWSTHVSVSGGPGSGAAGLGGNYLWSSTGPVSPSSSSHSLPSDHLYGSVGSGRAFTYYDNGTYTQTVSGSTSVYYYNWAGNNWINNGSRTVYDQYNVQVLNVAPTIMSATQNGTNGNITVLEGSTVALRMSSTDPGADAQAFTINGQSAGTGGSTPGSTRTSSIVNRTFGDNGTFSNTFQVSDGDGGGATVSRNVVVQNVAPTLQSFTLSSNLVRAGSGAGVTATFAATDPGTDTILFLIDSIAVISSSATSGTRTASYSFAPVTDTVLAGRAKDYDGGTSNSLSQTITMVGPEFASSVPVGSTLDFGGIAVGDSASLSLTLSNTTTDAGGDPLTGLTLLDAIFGGPDADLFSLSGFTSGMVLSQGWSSLFDVLFDPIGADGTKYATLTFVTDQNAAFGSVGDSFTFNLQAHATADPQTHVTPEPGSLALMGLGGIGLVGGAIRRRRRKPAS